MKTLNRCKYIIYFCVCRSEIIGVNADVRPRPMETVHQRKSGTQHNARLNRNTLKSCSLRLNANEYKNNITTIENKYLTVSTTIGQSKRQIVLPHLSALTMEIGQKVNLKGKWTENPKSGIHTKSKSYNFIITLLYQSIYLSNSYVSKPVAS